jgi:hypothetical protein
MSFRDGPATLDEFAATNVELSTSAASQFVKVVTAQRRLGDRVEVIRGLRHEVIEAGGTTTRDLVDRDEWFAVLADDFGLHFAGVAPAVLDELWSTWSDKHHRWVARQAAAADAQG